jgi:hypothetical protein
MMQRECGPVPDEFKLWKRVGSTDQTYGFVKRPNMLAYISADFGTRSQAQYLV